MDYAQYPMGPNYPKQGFRTDLPDDGADMFQVEFNNVTESLERLDGFFDEQALRGIADLATSMPEAIGEALQYAVSDHLAFRKAARDGSQNDMLDAYKEVEAMLAGIAVSSKKKSKAIKQRKAKSKPCLIEDILRNIRVPRNIREVMAHEYTAEFLQACRVELDAHEANGTWSLVPFQEDMHLVGSTWAFDIKRDMNKRILRFKARLCAQGFTQVKGIDYFHKYSHTIPLETLRLFMAKSAHEGLEVSEADYVTAYLNAWLDSTVYMKQPPEFQARDENGDIRRGPNGEELVCKVNKAIYGLVQSGLMWELEHHKILRQCGWEQCEGETCLFRKTIEEVTCYLCTYVDNLWWSFPPGSGYAANELAMIKKYFKVDDLGIVAYSLGARVEQNARTRHLSLHQGPMIDDIVHTYLDEDEEGSGERAIPAHESVLDMPKYDPTAPETAVWRMKCLKLGGKINYVACFTRPDISAALSFSMRNVAGAGIELFEALLVITRYLRDTRKYKLHYGAGRSQELKTHLLKYMTTIKHDPWSDFDIIWLADSSHGGIRPMLCAMGMVGGTIFCWKMARLTSTSLSSTEAEYFAQTEGAKAVQTLISPIKFLKITAAEPIIMLCDNAGAVCITEKDKSTKRMKHVITRMGYLSEQVDNNKVQVLHILKTGMIADIGTKILGAALFHWHRVWLVYD